MVATSSGSTNRPVVMLSADGVKLDWGFAMSAPAPAGSEIERLHAEVLDRCDRLFHRAREAGVLRPDTDLGWARRVYYALIHEVAHRERDSDDFDALGP